MEATIMGGFYDDNFGHWECMDDPDQVCVICEREVMSDTEIIHVVKRLTIEYGSYDGKPQAVLYEDDTYLGHWQGDTKDDVRREVMLSVLDTYDVPKSIETLEYRQLEELHERKDIRI
jgi:hypothetical protein